jgi:insulysin
LDPSALEREREAVNSEARLKERSDGHRLWYVIQDIMRASNHPFSHWGCGNLTTLSSFDQTNIKAWFKTEYDPRGMHLVVYSHEPLQVLERRVKAKFGKIPHATDWKGPVRAATSGEIIPPGVSRSWVFVEPIKNLKHLSMMWQIPDKFAETGNRVAEVVATSLGSVGDGTLLSKLKSEALATSIYASVENEAADAAFFYINVDLTTQGLANYRRVVEIVFQGLGTLGRLSPPAYIVEQHNTLSTLNYKWQQRKTDTRVYGYEVKELRGQDFASYPKKSLFWEHSPYDVAEIFLNHLSPNTSIIFIQAKSSDTFNVTFDKSEPTNSAKYTITNFTDEDLALFNTAHHSLQADVRYAPQSLYIPEQNLQLLRYIDPLLVNRSRWEPLPTTVKGLDPSSESFLSTFIAGDTEFGIPKISFRNSFFSPALNTGVNPRKEIVVYLWIKSVYETTEAMRAAAALGGYRYASPISC